MFVLQIETVNDAFKDDKVEEIIRIMENVITLLRNNITDNTLHDYNGNRVGFFNINREVV